MKSVLSLCLTMLLLGQLSAQCIQLQNCLGTYNSCDFTANNFNLWNESYWLDALHQTQDMADVPVDLTLMVTDTCASVTLRYLLFLDLDKNETWETIVKSWDPPAPGTVNFNNAGNPNFDGGELRNFDERPVPADGKYQFGIETITSGNVTQANVRWNTPATPNTFVVPELPYATHKIRWIAEDALGNNQFCEYPIVAKDCKKPTVVCLNGLSVNIMPTAEVTLWASDFLQYGEDNATSTNLLEYSIRKSGTGNDFPIHPDGSPISSVTFTCAELGTQFVELWVRDASGNADYCETYAVVQDAFNTCNGGGNNSSTPVLVCLNGLSVNLQQTGEFQLWTSDLLHYATDDNTPFNLLEFGVQACAAGNSFPLDADGHPNLNIIMDCDDLGNQCVELWVKDEDDHTAFCQVQVNILDNFNHCPGNGSNVPTVVCLNGLSANIMPTGNIMVWASDFLQYATDDNTPTNQLQFSLRRSGTGSGFPVDSNGIPIISLTFDCDELGLVPVELWGKDLDGNAVYCATTLNLEDPFETCPGLIFLDAVTDLSTPSASILPPVPNPTSAEARIPVQLTKAGQVRLEITDLSGKLIWQRSLELGAGSHMLEVAPQALPQTGVYVWRVQTGNTTALGKLIRI
jgi:hypothetical protein